MKVTKRQILKLINEEIENSNELYIDVDNILKEQKESLEEGFFGSALKTLATNVLPGGRVVSDFARSQAFDRIDEEMEEFETRLAALEATVAGMGVRSPTQSTQMPQMDQATLSQLQQLLSRS
tara:strand:+ start:406 stop:774 length:369 start_codon:yes stop_codon:yes gene_type:complete